MFPPDSSVLVACDLSPAASNTLRHVFNSVRGSQVKIRILHVVEPMSEEVRVTLMMFMQSEEGRKNALVQRIDMLRKEFAENLKTFWASLPEEQQALQQHVVATDVIEGYPAEVILQQAKKHQCDTLVLGAHEKGLNQTFLGSVAKRVLRRADIPTLIVPFRREVD